MKETWTIHSCRVTNLEQFNAEGGLNRRISVGNKPIGCSLPCNWLYMRIEEENQDVFYFFFIHREIIFVISQCHGRLTSTCVFPRRNCNWHLAKQFMQLVFKGFFGKGGRSGHGPNVPERLCERLGGSWLDIAGLRSSPHNQERSANAVSAQSKV